MTIDSNTILLSERVAVVTGAAQGIGRAIALGFAKLGADVAICDRDADGLEDAARLIEAEGSRALHCVLDVREEAAVVDFMGEVGRAFERIDVLVNNAGGGFHAPFLDVNAKGQAALVNENFSSVTHFVRAAVSMMRERGGSIINVTSIEAHRAGPGYAIYSAMKAAVMSLTKSLALELGDAKIRVNCVAPDLIPTPGVGAIDADPPLKRAGNVDDVAGAAAFLASDLSLFVTGSTIHVDGGVLAAGGWRRGREGRFTT